MALEGWESSESLKYPEFPASGMGTTRGRVREDVIGIATYGDIRELVLISNSARSSRKLQRETSWYPISAHQSD